MATRKKITTDEMVYECQHLEAYMCIYQCECMGLVLVPKHAPCRDEMILYFSTQYCQYGPACSGPDVPMTNAAAERARYRRRAKETPQDQTA
jgi:hypothetical protein